MGRWSRTRETSVGELALTSVAAAKTTLDRYRTMGINAAVAVADAGVAICLGRHLRAQTGLRMFPHRGAMAPADQERRRPRWLGHCRCTDSTTEGGRMVGSLSFPNRPPRLRAATKTCRCHDIWPRLQSEPSVRSTDGRLLVPRLFSRSVNRPWHRRNACWSRNTFSLAARRSPPGWRCGQRFASWRPRGRPETLEVERRSAPPTAVFPRRNCSNICPSNIQPSNNRKPNVRKGNVLAWASSER
ncbi:hypothetical protein Pla52o_47310 [Novipirellula galeiformis]|uniref:Uncharacterized protein n=1 Tax=Novipirellula galeiformis TaxID=2528004 RepID=A0A5C6CA11_9BACT|nr:hypothetical protein Pla52o_47310 [Novipirellula galeiformis]